MSGRCPCGAKLTKPAELAHGVCKDCRVDAKKRLRRKADPAPTLPLFDEPEHTDRRLVEMDGWPDYRRQGLV